MKTATLAVAVVACLSLAGAARGGLITFGLIEEFSGATPPEGTVPPAWLTVTIDDGADYTDGIVTLTLAATNLTGNEKIKEWYLNLDPSFDPENLVFAQVGKTGAFKDATISKGLDAFKAGGDGFYDIEFVFDHTGNTSKNFGAGESIGYTVSLSSGGTLTASSFDFLSTPAGGQGPYHTAAHVQSIGAGEDSGWITAPEPATLGVLATGTVFCLLAARRKKTA
ncbi:MAG TPA: PEP-CTERM sorting domain-containing protein [Phycisphaerae bacterium]|nr:PEP-CTERM sorting domain-containing protein [Phycisphaerae bacterium]